MKLSQMRRTLDENRVALTRSLGQNFLHDANQLRRIISAANLSRSDKVLEIGPGLGPLTEPLVAKAGEVLAIEKDARLVELLRSSNEINQPDRFTLVHDDALEFLKRDQRDWSAWKLLSNLPYSVASPILVELALSERGPKQMVVTLQLEVARRLMAEAGGADYGLLTLLVQSAYAPTEFFKISASCFFPSPGVDSACVSLVRRTPPLLNTEQTPVFVKLVKRGFSQRRKMLMKLLREDWPASSLSGAFRELKLSESIRAERVSLEQFVRLTRLLQSV